MPQPAFIVMGDIHLNPLTWVALRDVNGDTEKGFIALVDFAIEQHLPLILAGDIFDSNHPPANMMQVFRQQIDRCAEEGVDVYAIQGNHDKQLRVPWFIALHDHVRHLHGAGNVTINGVTVRGYDYSLFNDIQRHLAELSAQELPQCLILHQACKQALGFEGKWNCDLEWIPEDIPLIVLGDIHTEWHAVVRRKPLQQAYYTGPVAAREIGQIGPKSCIVVNDDLTIERAPLPYRQMANCTCSSHEEVQEIREWLQSVQDSGDYLPPFARIRHEAEFTVAVRELMHEFHDTVLFSAEVVEDVAEIEDTPAVVGSATARELLTQLIDPQKHPLAFEMVLELLESHQDPRDVIGAFRTHFLGDSSS